MKRTAKILLVVQFLAVNAIAAEGIGGEYNPPAAWKTCQQDSDCVQAANDCGGCCRSLAINKAYKETFGKEFKQYCKSYHGSFCECCAPDFVAKCQQSVCTLVEVPGSKKRKCGG